MLIPLDIPPGFNTEDSPYATGPRWTGGDNVRFRANKLEKIGGWILNTQQTFLGVARAIHGWFDLSGAGKTAIGTNKKLYIYYGGTLYDVTPVDESGTMANNPFTTTNGSPIVTVADTTHARSVGDYVNFAGASATGGITIDGWYTVTSIVDANTYTITHTANATSSVTGGGASVTFTYLLSVGNEYAFAGFGWGAGTWGASTWGTPRATSNITLQLRTWTMDNWGEDLIANPAGGYVYLWDNSGGTGIRATKITNAPKCNGIIISPNDRHLIALGAVPNGGTDIDPMLIRWSAQEDYNTWAPAATNTAGSLRLTDGSKIIGALRARNEILVWTDTALYSIQFLGPPYTFGQTLIATGCGLISPHGMTEHSGTVYWFGRNCQNFYSYNGNLSIVACPVLNHVQDDINIVQAYQVFAGKYKKESELHFFYASEGSTAVDKRVTLNFVDNTWTFGNMARSVWQDAGNAGFDRPIACDMSGQIWTHEIGNDGNNLAINAYAETGVIELGSGDTMTFFDKLIPDFERIVGDVSLTVYTRRYPYSTDIIKGPYAAASSTEKISVRGRGRQMRLRVESNVLGGDFRLGKIRLNVQPDGKR